MAERKSQETKARIEQVEKRNRKITIATGIMGAVVGTGVGACSQLVTGRMLNALLRPDEIESTSFRVVTKVGVFGIGSAVGTTVSKNMSEPFTMLGEMLCEDPGYADYATDVLQEITDDIKAKSEEEGEED